METHSNGNYVNGDDAIINQIDLFATCLERSLNDKVDDALALYGSNISLDQAEEIKKRVELLSAGTNEMLSSPKPIALGTVPINGTDRLVRSSVNEFKRRLDLKTGQKTRGGIGTVCDLVIDELFSDLHDILPYVTDYKNDVSLTKTAVRCAVLDGRLGRLGHSTTTAGNKYSIQSSSENNDFISSMKNELDQKLDHVLKKARDFLPRDDRFAHSSIYIHSPDEVTRSLLRKSLVAYGATKFTQSIELHTPGLTVVVKKGDEPSIVNVPNLKELCLSDRVDFLSVTLSNDKIEDVQKFKTTGSTVIVDPSVIENDYTSLPLLFDLVLKNSQIGSLRKMTLKFHHCSYERMSSTSLVDPIEDSSASILASMRQCEIASVVSIISRHECDNLKCISSSCLNQLVNASHLISRNVILLTSDSLVSQNSNNTASFLTVDINQLLLLKC